MCRVPDSQCPAGDSGGLKSEGLFPEKGDAAASGTSYDNDCPVCKSNSDCYRVPALSLDSDRDPAAAGGSERRFLRRFAVRMGSVLRKMRLVWRFYRTSLLLPCLCVSAALAWPVMFDGGPNVPTLCIAKVFCYAPLLYLFFSLCPRRFYYYANLGIPRIPLVAWSCIFDFLIFIVLVRAAAFFGPAANRLL